MGEMYTIKEAAGALGVSPDTIRRRIKKGEIKAEKMQGPYGQAYYIEENELFETAEIKEVVPFNKPMTEQDLKQIIREAVREETHELRQEVIELKQQLEEARMIEGKKQPWYKKLFKK